MVDIINREAGDKLKGTRLQKLRAISLMLDSIEKSESAQIYAAIEYKGDISFNEFNNLDGKEYYEENKNYEIGSSFTFNSIEILNTMVIFLDIWLKWEYSSSINFGFYSTNKISKEKKTERLLKLNITLPDKPILELLLAYNFDYPNLLKTVIKMIIKEYESQYESRESKGHLDLIKGFNDSDWKKFLQKIDWHFGQIDEIQLKTELLCKIKSCRYFNQHLEGRENSILSQIIELFDERLNIKDPVAKYIHASDIRYIFKISETSHIGLKKNDDPVWELWHSLPEPKDKRNLRDKIIDKCKSYNYKKIENLSRKVGANIIEEKRNESNKDFFSIKYRVFVECESELIILLEAQKDKEITEKDINFWIDHLVNKAQERINDLSLDYNYSFKSKTFIEGVVLELFDSCFLAFDGDIK